MNKEGLFELVGRSAPNICQIAVCQGGEEVYSQEWNGYRKTDCTHIMSATKSIMALLIGIAIDRGMLGGVDEKVLSFFPDYEVKRGEKTLEHVTLEHLLTMRAPYKGKGDPWTKVCASDDWTRSSLDFLGGAKGITDVFDYRTVCLHVLSGILYRASGMKTVDFANEYLFEPLGIARHDNFYAKDAEEHKHFTIDRQPRENVWFADPAGLGTPGYGLCMSASDMARIGQLCLNKGMWEGQQVVSPEWLAAMTKPRAVEDNRYRGMHYGYLWWIVHPERNIYAAIGNSGNVIYVNPEIDTTVAVASYFKPTVFDRIDFIEEILLPRLEPCSVLHR